MIELFDRAKVLDRFYIPPRYANAHPSGPPFRDLDAAVFVDRARTSVSRFPAPGRVSLVEGVRIDAA